MKNKIIMAMGAMALTAVLAMGISYAWFTDQAKADSTSAGAGYLNISLTGVPDDVNEIFPAEKGRTIDYTITNLSSREVVVQFKKGLLTGYVMPEDYLDKDGFIIKGKHEVMKELSAEQKMKANGETSDFVKLDPIPALDVISEVESAWDLTGGGSEYLGKDADGNQYFRLSQDGTATAKFTVALTADAGNRYQYALFTLGEATALATQDNDLAISAAFGIDIANLEK